MYKLFVSIGLLFLFQSTALHAQHDPARNAVRFVAAGELDKAVKVMEAGNRRQNGPLDPAEAAYVRSLIAEKQGNEVAVKRHEAEALRLGIPRERLLAGLKPARVEDTPPQLLHGPLLGNMTDSSVRFWVRTVTPGPVEIELTETNSKVRSLQGKTELASDNTALIEFAGLQPDTPYPYLVRAGGVEVRGSFRTFPRRAEGAKFSICFGGGAGYVSQYERMWTTINKLNPRALLLLGDNVYIDDPEHLITHRYCYARRQSQPAWRNLTARVPVYSIYDDHDFGMNDCVPGPEMDTPAWKRPVWELFRRNWNNPAYGGGDAQPGCWFDFMIGDVHFILLDGRYYRDLKGGSMLGPVQKRWLLDTLKNSKGTFKVLASPVPWSPGVKPGSRDTWDGFPEEREEIFSFIEKEGIEGVLLMAADRHRSDLRRIPRPGHTGFYEVMSSRLTNVHVHSLTEKAKGSEFILGYNKTPSVGVLDFDTRAKEPSLTYRIVDLDGKVVHTRKLKL